MTLRHLFLHNWRWKLFSLLLAAAIWFYVRASLRDDVFIQQNPVTGKATAEMWEEFPIHVLTAGQDAALYQVEPPGAKVTLQGDFASLQDLDWKRVRVFINLADHPAGDRGGPVEFERQVNVHLPANVSVARVDPTLVRVRRLPPAVSDKPAAPSDSP